MLKLSLVFLTLISSSLLLSSCATPQTPIDVYNKDVCAFLGKVEYPQHSGKFIGAHCKETLVAKSHNIEYEECVTKRVEDGGCIGLLGMDSQAYSDTESTIAQACQFITCDYKTREALRTTLATVHKIAQWAHAAKSRAVNFVAQLPAD